MLEFYNEDTNSGVATIYDRHILFNSKLIKFFNSAYRVRVGVDKETNELYFFMINKDYALSGEIDQASLLPISVSKSYVRVASKNLINFISDSFKLDFSTEKSVQFNAKYDELKKAIIVNMGGK